MSQQEVISSLKRVSKLAIAEVGDACKDDLKNLASAVGLSDTEIQDKFPELFMSDPEFSDPDRYAGIEDEEEGEEQEEDENQNEKE